MRFSGYRGNATLLRIHLVRGKKPYADYGRKSGDDIRGGESIRLAIAKKEEAEMQNRRPGPISSAISRVPKLLGFHIGR